MKNGRIDRLFMFVIFMMVHACTSVDKKLPLRDRSADWEIIGPGGGGATFIPTFSWQNPGDFLVRCDMTGSYMTNDGGASYRQINFANGAGAYAFDPLDSNIIYIGAVSLNRSGDHGKTWQQIFPAREDVVGEAFAGDHATYSIETKASSLYENGEGNISHIRVDPSENGYVYFSMDHFFYHTRDNGKTWLKKDCGNRIDFIYTNPTSATEAVYIFTTDSLFLFDKLSGQFGSKAYPSHMSPAFSFTGGVKKSTDSVIFYAIHHDRDLPVDQEFGYSELYTSTDRGTSWQRVSDSVISNAASGSKPSFSMVACAEMDAFNAYLVTNRYVEKSFSGKMYWYGALKTSDGGQSWHWCWKGGGGSGRYGVKDGHDALNLSDAWVQEAFGGEYIRLMDVGVYPADGNIAIVTDWYRTMKTIDGGQTWHQVYSDRVDSAGYRSRGLDVTTTYGVHFDPFDSNHIAISYTDIGYHHSFDGGKSWIRSTKGVPVEWINTCYWVVFDPAIKNKVWSAWSGLHDFPRGKMTRDPRWKERAKGGICVSEDGGKTWAPSCAGIGGDAAVTSIVLDTSSAPGNRILYAAVYNKGVYKSIDDGKTWALKNNGMGENTCAFELTLTPAGNLFLTVSPTPQHKDGRTGRSFYSGAVYRSGDGAAHWTRLKVSDQLLFPNGITYDPENPQHIYLGCWADIDLSDLVGGSVANATGGNTRLRMPGGVFFSEDNGTTWRSIFDEKQYVYDVTADDRHPGRFYINTFNKAAYRSDDYGKTWKKLRGYDFHWGQRAVIDPHDVERIYLTTFGSSVWHGNPVTE